MTIGVYRIVNKIDGKSYVGKSKDIEVRFSGHKSLLKRDIRSVDCNRYLFNAVKKYGLENFDFEILESFDVLDEDELANAELRWIVKLDSTNRDFGYNLRMDSSTKCYVHQETIELMSKNNTGDKNPNYGNTWSDDQKKKASLIQLQRHSSGIYGDAWKSKLSEKSKQYWSDGENRKNVSEKLKVIKLKYGYRMYKDGVLIKEHPSINDVIADNMDFKKSCVYNTANGYKKSYKGFTFEKFIS